jgi:hypothetical protein
MEKLDIVDKLTDDVRALLRQNYYIPTELKQGKEAAYKEVLDLLYAYKRRNAFQSKPTKQLVNTQ